MDDKIKEVEKLISQGLKVYVACKQADIKVRDYYSFRNKSNSKRPLNKTSIKKATEILYRGMTQK